MTIVRQSAPFLRLLRASGEKGGRAASRGAPTISVNERDA